MDTRNTEFINPPKNYRSRPFWAWNDELQEDEIRFQIQQMDLQGMGGFFMHSRDGLETEYMGNKWMSCVRAAVDEAKKRGMTAWLYDEDRWPSGTAGGQVTREGGDQYRCKGLTLEVCEPNDLEYLTDEKVCAVYAARIHEMDIATLRSISQEREESLLEGEIRLVARIEVSGKSEWFNHESPPDNLNPDTVRSFIEKTHDKYYAYEKEEFGTTIPGIFTDEPSLADRHTSFHPKRGWIPWTYGLEEYYKKNRKRDFFETLPYIYFNGEKSSKARHDYWNTISERYCESYSKVISEWCEAHGIALTGHFLQEDKLGLGARVNGSIMPHYQYQKVPGIDMLGEETEEYMTVKQCTSVAHQFDRKEILTETYGWTGWDFTFEGMKWIGDWQYALGINTRSLHLALYSLRGLRKRDYPPCINYNTSWWEKNWVIEDYFARLGMMLQVGEPVRNLLVIHPMSTAWCRLGTNPYGNPVRRYERDVPAINEYGYQFNKLLEELCRDHIDFDLGDEILMEQYGRVKDNKVCINKAEYKFVLVPSLDSLKENTVRLLEEFSKQGGQIIWMMPTPYLLEGEESERVYQLPYQKNQILSQGNAETLWKLEQIIEREVSIRDQSGKEDRNLLYQFRKTEEQAILFLANNNRYDSTNVTIHITSYKAVEEWDLLTGQVKAVPAEINMQKECSEMVFQTEFKGCDSKLYVLYKEMGEEPQSNKPVKTKRLLYEFPQSCNAILGSNNIFTIDHCRYRMKNDVWSEDMEIWQAQYQIREKLHMQQVHINGMEQRYKWIKEASCSNIREEVELKYEFLLDEVPKGKVYLVVERPHDFSFALNDQQVDTFDEGWFLDKSFRKIALPTMKKGINTLSMKCFYRKDFELEMCYLAGEFGVMFNSDHNRVIGAWNSKLSIGDWTQQGLLHYPGSVKYQYSFLADADWMGKKLMLSLEEFSAVCMTAHVNEVNYEIPWKAVSDLDVSDAIHPGFNTLEVEVFSSPRNMMGPFHLSCGKRTVTNDECFSVTGEEHTDLYNLVPYGLFSSPRLYEMV